MEIYKSNSMEITGRNVVATPGMKSSQHSQLPTQAHGKVGWKQSGLEVLCPGSLQILAEEAAWWFLVAD